MAIPLRFLALGDSYTIGEGVSPEARWPGQLATRLWASGVEIEAPEIVAVTGWRTDELETGIDAAVLEPPYALVTLLIGVNDQYDGVAPEAFRVSLRALLARAIGFAGGAAGRVVVVSIPDWGATAFGAADARGPATIAREIDAFNAVARETAEASGVRWADITPLSRTQGALTVADGLHPDAEAYTAWADHLLPLAQEALNA